MKRNPTREWTVDEFDAWMKATDKEEAIAKAADEEGGPRLSLVPSPEGPLPAGPFSAFAFSAASFSAFSSASFFVFRSVTR